jgi:rare lipoprotein A
VRDGGVDVRTCKALAFICCWVIAGPLLAAPVRGPNAAQSHAYSSHHAGAKAPTHLAASATQIGKASYYAKRFAGRRMADGTRLKLKSNAAASRTLPLGTRARVTNLRTGSSAIVEIKDRGPYVKGRIIDLTPETARHLDIARAGVVPVEVVPIKYPSAFRAEPNPAHPDNG